MAEKIVQTAGRNQLGEFSPMFAHLNDDVLFGRSGQNLADNAGSGNWIEGDRFDSGISEDELKSWIEGLV